MTNKFLQRRLWVFIAVAAGFMFVLQACVSYEADPNATPVAVVQTGINQADLGTRQATVSAYQTLVAQQTQSAGFPASDALTPEGTPLSLPVVVLVNAECRFGPGTEYGVVMTLFSGEGAAVLGIGPSGTWYFIEIAQQVRCWVLGSLLSFPAVASTSGAAITSSPLPVFTPPPPPFFTLTPTFFPTQPGIGTPSP